MAKKTSKAKPKWLEAETPELLNTLKEVISVDEVDDKAVNKALKIVDELISRLPNEDEGQSVLESIELLKVQLTAAADKVAEAYQAEISMIEESEDDSDEDEDEDEEEEEEVKPAKGKKSKPAKEEPKPAKGKGKKSKPQDDEEEEEDDDDSDEDEDDDDSDDYSDWSIKDLKKECRDRGIKVNKSMGKSALVKALEADDKE